MINIKKIFISSLFFIIILCSRAYAIDFSAYLSSWDGSRVQIRIIGDADSFDVYKSSDYKVWELQSTVIQGTKVDPGASPGGYYYEYGVNPGTYYYKIVASTGEEFYLNAYIPFSTNVILPLQVVDFGDKYIHLEWNALLSSYSDSENRYVSIFVDGVVKGTNITENNYTITSLNPGQTYRIYIVSESGWKSNTIRITTTNVETSILNRLDDILKKIFIPKTDVDSDNDGISDAFDKLVDAINRLNNYSPITMGQTVKAELDQLQNNIPSGPVLGNSNASMSDIISSLNDDTVVDAFKDFELKVTFAPGLTFNVFDLNRYKTVIAVIRAVLVAVLFIELFLFFLKVLVPVFKL